MKGDREAQRSWDAMEPPCDEEEDIREAEEERRDERRIEAFLEEAR